MLHEISHCPEPQTSCGFLCSASHVLSMVYEPLNDVFIHRVWLNENFVFVVVSMMRKSSLCILCQNYHVGYCNFLPQPCVFAVFFINEDVIIKLDKIFLGCTPCQPSVT